MSNPNQAFTAAGDHRLVETDLSGTSKNRVSNLPSKETPVFCEVCTDATLPAPANRIVGWQIFNITANIPLFRGFQTPGDTTSAARWVDAAGNLY